MSKFHGNSKQNKEPHHLYEVIDKLEDDTFKYGISSDPINEKDDLSNRVRNQVTLGNLFAGWLRYFGRILIKNIAGNAKARAVEDKYLEDYYDKNGRYPRGNRDRKHK